MRRSGRSTGQTVAVLAPSHVGLARVLSRALGPQTRVIEIDSLPSVRQAMGWIIVIDPVDFPNSQETARLDSLADAAFLYILLRDGVTRSEWLMAASNPKVRIVPSGKGILGTAPIVAALRETLLGPPADILTGLVLKREPSLRVMRAAVQAVLAQPWVIRRPRDLSRILGIGIVELGHQVRSLGLLRIEHFILLVRMVTFEVIVGSRYGVPPRIARVAVGFSDPSNMRRQVDRALKNTDYEDFTKVTRRAG